ncbi:hypothetical protein AVEN_185820-1, partial [Araneus ventricosus]
EIPRLLFLMSTELMQSPRSTDLVILNSDEDDTWTHAPPPNLSAIPAKGHMTLDVRVNVHQVIDVDGFEPGALRHQSRNLTTRPLGPYR